MGFGDEERGDRPARAKASEKTVRARAGGRVRTAGRLSIGALVVGAVGIVVLGARPLRDLLRG
ncbi:MAG TPA: hypothetical protein VKP64_01770 [Mycobacteriales bacterium]|nr:hypothetical protein [Mycobacteriales bacterium]